MGHISFCLTAAKKDKSANSGQSEQKRLKMLIRNFF